MRPDKEQIYMLRLWQDEETVWRASLKKMNRDGGAQYFHTVESLVRFLKSIVHSER